jgi:hypothetical protein
LGCWSSGRVGSPGELTAIANAARLEYDGQAHALLCPDAGFPKVYIAV